MTVPFGSFLLSICSAVTGSVLTCAETFFFNGSLAAKDQDGMLNSINNLLLLSYNCFGDSGILRQMHRQRLPPKLGPGYQEGWRKRFKRHEMWALLQFLLRFVRVLLSDTNSSLA